MKKVLKSFMLIAVAAVAFSACQKEISQVETPIAEDFLYSFAINNVDDGSLDGKALLEGDGTNLYLKWEDGDLFGAYATNGLSNSNNRPSSVAVSGSSYTLKVASTTELAAGSTVYAYYPYNSGAGSTKTNVIIKIDPIQTQKSSGFDASVMPMVGEPYITTTTLVQNSETEVGQINFANLGSVIEFNIYSTSAINEQIKSVQFNSTSGNLAGNFSLDLTAVDFKDDDTIELQGNGSEASVKTSLETPVDIPVSTVSAKEGTKVYMSVAPGAYSGTIVVSTTGHTYTFNVSSSITFNRSRIKRLNANLSSATPGDLPVEDVWEVVTSPSDFTAGTYVIVSSDKTNYLVNEAKGKNPASATAHWDGSGNLTNVTDDAKWIATTSGSGLQFASFADDSKYLWQSTTTAQGVSVAAAAGSESIANQAKVWTLVQNSTLGGDSGYIATTGGNRYLALYTNGTWRCYSINDNGYLNGSSDIKAAIFYKLQEAPDPRQESTIVANDMEVFVGQTKAVEYDIDPDGGVITLSLGTGAEDYVSVSGLNVTGVAATTSAVPVILSYAGDKDYKPTSENVNVTVHAVPAVISFGQSQSGFSATLNEILDGFTYSWVLYHGSVAAGNIVSKSNRTTSSASFSATFADDLDINSFTVGDSYILVVTATKSSLSASSANVSFVAEDLDSIVEGANWVYTFTAKIWEEQGAQTLNGKSWTIAGTNKGSGSEYYNYDATKGQQFGSGNNAFSPLSLTSNFGGTYGVREIRVSTSGGSGIVGTVSVSVGGTAFLCASSETADLTSTNTTYAFVSPDGNLKAGDIQISYAQTSSKAIYIKKIIVNPAPATKLVMSDITCTDHSSSSVTFGWTAVTGAVDYEVSTDGTNYVSTNNTLSYTWGGRQPETNYTIWVKAIGDGDEYSTSDPKQSAIGTTDAASQGIPDPETFTMVSTNVATYTGSAGSVTFNKGGNNSNVPTWNTTDSAVRCYQKNTITVSADNSNIASIVMTVKVRASSGKNPSLEITSGGGTIDPETCTTSTTTITWTAGATDTDEVVFTLSSVAGNINFKSIEVTYK